MHRYTCEALVYVLAGRGYSLLRRDGELPRRIEWQAGDLRYLEITTLPLMKAVGAWTTETAPDDA